MTERSRRTLPVPVRDVLEPVRCDEDALWARVRRARRTQAPQGAEARIPLPVAQVLSEAEALGSDRARHWRAITARRRDRTRPAVHRAAWVAGGLAAALAIAFLALAPIQGRPSPTEAGEPLKLASGEVPQAEEAGDEPRGLTFSDASRITLAPGARVVPLASSSTRFEVLLERGSAEFSVTPGGPRQWSVEAGLARVEVVGTVFQVKRGQDSLEVSVRRGVVLVRGEAVPGRVQRLTAGQNLRVEAAPPASAPSPSVEPAAPALEADAAEEPTTEEKQAAEAVPAETAPSAHSPTAQRPNWRAAFAAGQYDVAYRALGSAGLRRRARQANDPEELLRLADVARLSNHPQDAVLPLTRVLDDFGHRPHAAVAAFTLGRVLLDQLSSPQAAAHAFERAISLRPPHALLEDCHVRLVHAHARAGDHEAARHAATRYRALFPTGRYLSDVERWAPP